MMEEDITPKNIRLLILVRFFLIVCCLIAISIQQSDISVSAIWQAYSCRLLIWMFFVNAVYLLVTRFWKRPLVSFAIIQISIDLLVETLLIYLTGGILSIFVSLYFCSILAAGMLISPNSSFICASLTTIGISGVAFLYFIATLDNIPLPIFSERFSYPYLAHSDLPFAKAYLFAQGVAFYLVAFLTNRLSIALSRVRNLHEEILQNLADGVLVVDTRQNLIFINAQAQKLLGLSSASSKDQKITQVLAPEKHGEIFKSLLMQRSSSFNTEIFVGNQPIAIHLTVSTLRSRNTIRSYIIIIRDIRDQKKMEEAIKRADRLETFFDTAATIAHEIRNPLASIRGSVQELKNWLQPQEELYLLMDIAIRESDRIDRIVGEFLQLSRIRAPLFKIIDLGILLEEFLLFWKQRHEMQQAQMDSTIEKGLFIEADSGHLRQVFYNLAINALEASSGELYLKIAASHGTGEQFCSQAEGMYGSKHSQGDGVIVTFADNGKGIESQQLANIFRPFFTTKEYGTGMGLALVSRILGLHQACWHISSSQQKGTVFSIWFPEAVTG